MKTIKKILKNFYAALAIRNLSAFFEHEAHSSGSRVDTNKFKN